MNKETVNKIGALDHVALETEHQQSQNQSISEEYAESGRFIFVGPDEMIVRDHDPGDCRDDQPVPEYQIVGGSGESVVEHEGAETPDAGSKEKRGKYLVRPRSRLLQNQHEQDGKRCATSEGYNCPEVH